MYKRKYKPGREIISFEGLRYYLKKDKFVYLRNKIQAEGWVLSLQFRTLIQYLDQGLIKRAKQRRENLSGIAPAAD